MDRYLSPYAHLQSNSGNTTQLDHINKLPDDLLLVILDKLTMKEAINTSLISKRWSGLWKSKSRIDLSYSWIRKNCKTFLYSLHNILCVHRQPKIKCISMAHRHYRSKYFEMEVLMELVASKMVDEIHLDMNDMEDSTEWSRRYPFAIIRENAVPEDKIHPYSSLQILSLKFLQLQTLAPILFIALRELFLEQVKLVYDSVEKITTNCPSLELLSLCNCNPTSDLNLLVADCSSLVSLIIKEDLIEVSNQTKLFIRAVNVKTVEFGLALPRKEYHLEGTLKRSELTFRLNEMRDSQQELSVMSQDVGENSSDNFNFLGILNEFRSAKVLKLNSFCIQVISKEVVKFKAPQFLEVTHLTLETSLETREFPGIAYMLLACLKLQNLVIVMGNRIKFDNVEEYRYPSAPNGDYPRALQDLTMVEFRNFYGNYQTWDDGSFDVGQFFSGYRYATLLLSNLTTYAKNLKNIVFITRRKRYETDQFQNFQKLTYSDMLDTNSSSAPRLFIDQFD